jgi:ParB/RepB/Spo0J family partition protein
MTDLQQIDVNEIDPHPDNPRLFLREDVIEGIKAQLQETGRFDPAHALLVRPVNGRYQIVRGHHRLEAAKRAGLESVSCWVREMTDDEAYMQLALGNVQGELSPLEIGRHALGLEDGEKGRGIKGGFREYARQIGKDESYVRQIRKAAEVLGTMPKNAELTPHFLGKAQHLAAIHSTPLELWPLLTQWLVTPEDKPNKQPSVNRTQDLVKQIGKFNIPKLWQFVFLPLTDIVGSYLKDEKPSPEQVGGLVQSADQTLKLILAHRRNFGPEFSYSPRGFYDWLSEGVGTYAWDKLAIDNYRQDVIAAAQEALKPPKPNAQPGEWYKLGEHLLYCGDTGKSEFWANLPQVAFAFADPPYNADVAEWDSDFVWEHDWLIDKAPIVAVTPGIESIQDFYRNSTEMPYSWSISIHIKNGMTRGKLGFGNWIYVGIFSEKETSLHRNAQDFMEVTIKTSETEKSEHKGRKSSEMMHKLIELFTETGDVVIDPFLGSGTTLFEADKLGRACIGGEIRPGFCNDIINQWQEETGQAAEKIKREQNPLFSRESAI